MIASCQMYVSYVYVHENDDWQAAPRIPAD